MSANGQRGGLHRPHRLQMFDENPTCFWCGTWLVKDFMWNNGSAFDRVATIDHVYPKGHPSPFKDRKLVVLACWRCNQDRNTIHVEFQKISASPQTAPC